MISFGADFRLLGQLADLGVGAAAHGPVPALSPGQTPPQAGLVRKFVRLVAVDVIEG